MKFQAYEIVHLTKLDTINLSIASTT